MRKRAALASVILGAVVGGGLGVGGYTFIYAQRLSYLTNDPPACANCHVMQGHLDAWSKSSHHAVAVCNDCHAPHDFFGKYQTKAVHGWNHSLAFTTGRFHEPIMIGEASRRVTEQACRRCHQDIVKAIDTIHSDEDDLSCIRCHESVGHWR